MPLCALESSGYNNETPAGHKEEARCVHLWVYIHQAITINHSYNIEPGKNEHLSHVPFSDSPLALRSPNK